MTVLETWVQTPAAKALGWTLFHSLWQGALAAAALAAALAALGSSRARYGAACLAMFCTLGGFVATFAYFRMQPNGAPAMVRAIPPAPDGEDAGRIRQSPAPWRAADILPWLAPFWMAGVLVFHLRGLAGWVSARRMGRRGVCAAPDPWPARLRQLGARLRLSRTVALLESSLAEVPVVIGHLRPVILMPVGLLAGLAPGQVETILLHELAHIRRFDYLVNLLQTSVEGLLFYHPAVWWISSVMRGEREHCCDDLVVATTGDAHEYAAALAALEQSRWAAREAALAATGGNLMMRIRRMLYPSEGRRAAWAPVASAAILFLAAATAVTAWQARPADRARQAMREPASPYEKWMKEDVAYIIADEERAAFQQLQTDEEREHFIEQFWQRRDPTPNTVENEFKDEHYRRIAYANDHYAAGVPGWKTDRGRIYIVYGPADEIESHPKGGPAKPYPFEQWLYHHIDGVGDNVIIEFDDPEGTGEYRMTKDPDVAVFSSSEPGAKATVSIGPDRKVQATVPLAFEAKRYLVYTRTHTQDGRVRGAFQRVVSLCKDSAGAPGCLERPVVQPAPTWLEPGSYVMSVLVKDEAGTNSKSYTVNFEVK